MDEKVRAEIARLYRKGYSCRQIEPIVGYSQSTVRLAVIKSGVPMRPKCFTTHHGKRRVMTPDLIQRAKKLYRIGCTCERIGKILNFTTKTILRNLKKAGVKMRRGTASHDPARI